jgi:hypothetical protein
MKARITITLEDNGNVRVAGPLADKALFQRLLRAAFEAQKEHERRQAPKLILPPFRVMGPKVS